MIILMCFHDDGHIVMYTFFWPEMKAIYDKTYPNTEWIEG